MIIDTHLHLIDKSALNYPWLGDVPALNRDFLFETYRKQAERCGIKAALHMEVDVSAPEIVAETAHIMAISRQNNGYIKGAIASCRPEEPGFAEYLEQSRSNPFIKGFRRVLHVVPDNVSEGALFRENIKRLEGTGLTFDLCTLPHQIDKVLALADLAPDVQFVLDHCGVPDIKSGALEVWQKGIAEIAQRDNVVAKISGVVAYADAESWTVDTLRPYVEHVIQSFGWERIVWGSDWPVCTLASNVDAGLSTWVATTHALLKGCSEDEKALLLADNAQRIWKI
ncbi:MULTISPECIES: amidohydrolase family protein [Brucella]|jgi:predicted TIM-barrel fold metal-dependent hydrolase|uniref:amidohydrolase family protein n=1 Tax=Brucella TaxID=234 RepID=UPI0009A209A8|nr:MULTISPECIES: amidohydrolase [Brucella]MBK0020212.1 amidohydrolase [Ochrobactrum sp. S45]MBK0043048.1 amidohydrolase [Ochrobactrum sp. S46]UKK92079.1 amidohydrolase [Brucella pseudogrignonensis]